MERDTSAELEFKSADLYGDTTYTDFTIKFSGKTLRAHKVILCRRSKYFERALGSVGAFKESTSGVIELNDDDPVAVEDMLYWLYTSERPIELTDRCSAADWLRAFELLFVTDKYALPYLTRDLFAMFQHAPAPSSMSSSQALQLVSRIADYPSDREGQVKDMMFHLCSNDFRECYASAEFRNWLDAHPQVRDRLYEEDFGWLLRQDPFRSQLKSDPALSLEWLEDITSRCPDW